MKRGKSALERASRGKDLAEETAKSELGNGRNGAAPKVSGREKLREELVRKAL